MAPAEIEDLLCSHPGIRDACVVGVEDDEAGEVSARLVETLRKSASAARRFAAR